MATASPPSPGAAPNAAPGAAPAPAQPAPNPPLPVPLTQLFTTFLRIGLTSFGGSTQAWIYRSIVEQRRWLDDKDYLTGLAISQILPGANPVNISLYVGQRLRGGAGAAVAAIGMVLPGLCMILLMAASYARLRHFPLTHFILLGIAAAGVGATLAAGLKVSRKLERRATGTICGIATCIAVGILHWPMLAVIGVLAPLSVITAYREHRNA